MMQLNVKTMTIGLMAACGLLTACSSPPSSSSNSSYCAAAINSATQSGNTFSAFGSFSHGQPLLRLTQGSSTYFATPLSNTPSRADFNITGVPKGVYTAKWDMSCDNADATPDITSHVPTITIT